MNKMIYPEAIVEGMSTTRRQQRQPRYAVEAPFETPGAHIAIQAWR
jgi:hypothetical protein